MLTMLQRMAIWTQHLQVAQLVVATVSVFVMDTKNVRRSVVSAPNASDQHVSFDHVFSHSGKVRPPHFFGRFVDTSPRAIFAFARRRPQKNAAAMLACVRHGAFLVHGLVVAFRRAILGFVCAASNVRKRGAALLASAGNLHPTKKCETLATTEHCGVFAVLGNRKDTLALPACFFVPNSGAFRATH